MNNKQMKKATVDAINVMISHADKGPSGFWVEDHEGCGNPAVFPEFEEGLKRGRLCLLYTSNPLSESTASKLPLSNGSAPTSPWRNATFPRCIRRAFSCACAIMSGE